MSIYQLVRVYQINKQINNVTMENLESYESFNELDEGLLTKSSFGFFNEEMDTIIKALTKAKAAGDKYLSKLSKEDREGTIVEVIITSSSTIKAVKNKSHGMYTFKVADTDDGSVITEFTVKTKI